MVSTVITRYRAAYSGLTREVWIIAFALFVNRCGAMVLPFMTLYLTQEIGMLESHAGKLISVYGLGAIVGAYLGGRLTKRVGAIRIQTVCLFLTVPAVLVLPLFTTWRSIAAGLFFMSVVSEAVRPASAMAVAQYSKPENRTRAFALQRLAANLGMSFGPAVGGFLSTVDYELLFVVDALTTLVGACVILGFFRMRRTQQEVEASGEAAPQGSRSPLWDGGFVAFLGLILFTNLVFFQFQSTYPLYMRDHFLLSKPQIGLMFAVNTVVIVIFEMLLIDAVRKWNLIRTIGWGSALACLGFGLLPFGSTGTYCVFCMVVLTIGEMLSFPLATGFAANRGDEGNQAMYLSWYTVTHSIACVIGPAIGTSVYETNRELVWYLCVATSGLVLIGFYVLAAGISKSDRQSAATSVFSKRIPQRDAS